MAISIRTPEPRDPAKRERDEERQRITGPLGAFRVERANMAKSLEMLRATTAGAAPRDSVEIIAAIEQLKAELRMANCLEAVRETTGNLATIDAEIMRLENELHASEGDSA